jgi:ASC-1-like (ASCH) protein
MFKNGRIFRREGESSTCCISDLFGSPPLGNMLRKMGFERISPKELSFERLLEFDATRNS